MKRIKHELMLRDEGLPSERVVIRSSIPDPDHRNPSYVAEMMHQESSLPASVSEYLVEMMRKHHAALAREAGEKWVGAVG